MVLIVLARCVCNAFGTSSGSIDGVTFNLKCKPYPLSTLLRDHNDVCDISTYEVPRKNSVLPSMETPSSHHRALSEISFFSLHTSPTMCSSIRDSVLIYQGLRTHLSGTPCSPQGLRSYTLGAPYSHISRTPCSPLQGGTLCCSHKSILLDLNQTVL